MDKGEVRQFVGNQIRTYRELRGIQLENLADAVGLSAQQMGRIESGQLGTPFTRLVQIAHLLGIRVGDLFPDAHTNAPSVDLELAFRREGLSKDEIEKVMEYVDMVRTHRVVRGNKDR